MPLGDLKTEHMINGEWVSENDLRQKTYQMNQQKEARQPMLQPLSAVPLTKGAKRKTEPASTKVDKAVLDANKSDLNKRNIR